MYPEHPTDPRQATRHEYIWARSYETFCAIAKTMDFPDKAEEGDKVLKTNGGRC
jgi:hypothetical protein